MQHPFRFRPNPDELHCVPCSVGMLIEGMTGDYLSIARLEEICNFIPGKEVWEFGWILHVANLGYRVRIVEDFDPQAFIQEPRAELLRQTGTEDVVRRYYEVSDVSGQVPLVQQCVAHPLIEFEQRVPSLADLANALQNETAALVNVNARVLNGKDGYAGHVVLVYRRPDGQLIVEDPGPPPHEGAILTDDEFCRAWMSPSPDMANFVSIGPTR